MRARFKWHVWVSSRFLICEYSNFRSNNEIFYSVLQSNSDIKKLFEILEYFSNTHWVILPVKQASSTTGMHSGKPTLRRLLTQEGTLYTTGPAKEYFVL